VLADLAGPSWSWRLGVAVVLTGVGAGIGGIVLILLLHAVQRLAYGYRSGPFLEGVQHASSVRLVLALTAAGLITATAWWALRRWAEPLTGSGVAVRSPHRRMQLLPTVADGVIQIVAVAAGASLGREAAPKEVGAASGSALAERIGLSVAQRRLLVACGAGAGMAAVYNVPLGGALFALEVLLGSVTLRLAVPAVVSAAVATAVAGLARPDLPTYLVPRLPSSPSLLVFAAVLGPVAGLAGVAIIRLSAWARRGAPTGWRLVPSITLAFAGLGVVGTAVPQLLGNGQNEVQLAATGQLGVGLLLVLAVGKPLATAACLRAGATGGLFTPVLTTGAALGGLAGLGWGHLWPGTTSIAGAVVLAAATLGAASLGPLSSLVLVLELTGTTQGLVVPMVIAVAGATLTSRALDGRSIYTSPTSSSPAPPSPTDVTSGRSTGTGWG